MAIFENLFKNSNFKLSKVDPEKYLVGKNGEIPELPTLVLEGDPIGNIQSAFVEPGCRLVVFDAVSYTHLTLPTNREV